MAASSKATTSAARAFQAKQRSKLLEARYCQQAAQADIDALQQQLQEGEAMALKLEEEGSGEGGLEEQEGGPGAEGEGAAVAAVAAAAAAAGPTAAAPTGAAATATGTGARGRKGAAAGASAAVVPMPEQQLLPPGAGAGPGGPMGGKKAGLMEAVAEGEVRLMFFFPIHACRLSPIVSLSPSSQFSSTPTPTGGQGGVPAEPRRGGGRAGLGRGHAADAGLPPGEPAARCVWGALA